MEIEIRREPEDLPVPDSDIAAVRRAVETVGRLYGAGDAAVSYTNMTRPTPPSVGRSRWAPEH